MFTFGLGVKACHSRQPPYTPYGIFFASHCFRCMHWPHNQDKMPGRVSARTSTTSRASRKSAVPTLNTRASTSSRVVSDIPEEGPSTTLRTSICSIFGDAQRTTTGHRKLVVNLRKVHEACCYEPSKRTKGSLEEYGEEEFNIEAARCVIRITGIKKSEGAGDRLVRFLGLFLKHANEKGGSMGS